MGKFDRLTKSSNPILGEKAYQEAAARNPVVLDSELVSHAPTMTVQGAINKTFILSGIMLVTTLFSFMFPSPLLMWGGAIGGLIAVIAASYKVEKSAIIAPIYAAFEGLFVGGVSAYFAAQFGGIIFQAVSLTLAVLFMMLFIYKAGIIKVTEKFKAGVMMATGAVLIVYILNLVLSMFGMNIPYLHEGGVVGVGISLVIIGIAALNLLLDFDNFEKGEKYHAPLYMEWFSAMGLLVTLVWLYVEILRLLAIFAGDD